ncbi:MAG: DUF3786 domain-containing protein [Deltaproteobacteria bacterium]|jgi:hypothetical protein|nr:DUF3786 domain-containing protein [Deltaproteobacteria bacterium]
MEISGYEKNYRNLAPGLKDFDFASSCARLGLRETKDGAEIEFLGRLYRLSREGVEAADGEASDPNFRSILVHYALSQGEGGPGEEFLALFQLPGVMRGRNQGDNRSLLNGPMYERFGREGHDGFREAAGRLGGEYLGPHPAGGHLWEFRVLPRISLRVIYVEPDEEFPLELNVLFDSHSPEILGFECLAFLQHCLSQALASA